MNIKFIEIDNNKLGSFKLLKVYTPNQIKLLKQFILTKTIKEVKASVLNTNTGIKIKISKSGLKHSLSVLGSIKKIKCLTAIESILKTAYLTNVTADKHNKKLKHFIFSNIVSIDKEIHFIDINIKEDANGNFLYHYNLMNIKKPNAKLND